jgi:type II secretory pathway component PulF
MSWNSKKTLEFFQFYLFNRAVGAPIDRLLIMKEIGESRKDKSWVEICDQMVVYATNGSSAFVSKTMSLYPKYFPRSLTRTVNEAELSGRLDDVIPELEKTLRVEAEMRSQAFGPFQKISFILVLANLILVVACVTTLGGLVDGIRNKDLSPYPGFGPQVAVVLFIHDYPWLYVFSQIGLAIGVWWALKQSRVQEVLESFAAKIPILKAFINLRWYSYLGAVGVMIKSGTPLAEALERNIPAAGAYVGAAMSGVVQHMQVEGNSLRSFLKRSIAEERIFPEILGFLTALERMEPARRIEACEQCRDGLATQIKNQAASMSTVLELVGYLPIALIATFVEVFITQFGAVYPKLLSMVSLLVFS